MKSTSEVSYGARIGNAEKLVIALQNFSNYQPVKSEFSIASFNNLIVDIKAKNNLVAEKKQNYSLAVENRKQIFETGPNSIGKRLSPINGAVKVSFGRTAKESTDIASIIAKIRGANNKTKKTATPEEASVSQSYQSYNSKAQFFSDLIVNLTNLSANYTPSNQLINISELNTLYNQAISANGEVMNSFTQFSQTNKNRIADYLTLSQTAIRIKDGIKAQYGNNSTEYKLIKGLKI